MSGHVQAVAEHEATRPRAALLLCAYSVLYVIAAYLTNEFVLTEGLLQKEWSIRFDADHVSTLLDHRRRWTLIGYGFIPLLLLAKIGYTSVCLSTACTVMDWRLRFREIFQIAVHAEIVFAMAAVVHLIWSVALGDFASMAEYAGFYPLSALHLVTIDASELWMAYPLKTANLFEIAYVALLAWNLKTWSGRPLRRSLALVVCSYGTGLLLIVSAVTFLALYTL